MRKYPPWLFDRAIERRWDWVRVSHTACTDRLRPKLKGRLSSCKGFSLTCKVVPIRQQSNWRFIFTTGESDCWKRAYPPMSLKANDMARETLAGRMTHCTLEKMRLVWCHITGLEVGTRGHCTWWMMEIGTDGKRASGQKCLERLGRSY